jgi:hypothetical protein
MSGVQGTRPERAGEPVVRRAGRCSAGDLVRAGPWLLTISVILVTAAFALTRRPRAAVPALLAGAVAYAGMYAQPSLAVMYVSIAVAYAAWAGLMLWVRAAARRGSAPVITARFPDSRVGRDRNSGEG